MTQDIEFDPGRITLLRTLDKSPERVSVHIEGRFAFSLHQDVVLEFGLSKGKSLGVEEQARMIRQDLALKARALALRYMTYRDRTAAEVRRRLHKTYSEEIADEVVERLKESGLLDDRAFAEAFAERRFRQEGHGPARVRADMLRKGVAPAVLEAALDVVFGEQDALEDRAAEVGRTWWRRLSGESDPMKRKKKVCDYLVRRGYPFDLARRVVFDLANETDRQT